MQVLFQGGKFRWDRLQNLVTLAQSGTGAVAADLTTTVSDGLRVSLVGRCRLAGSVELCWAHKGLHHFAI